MTGLITAVDGNGIGGKGVAGAHQGDRRARRRPTGGFTVADLIRGVEFSVERGRRCAEPEPGEASRIHSRARLVALDSAFINDVLPVAGFRRRRSAANGNPVEFPAAALGGRGAAAAGSDCRCRPPSRTAACRRRSRPTTSSSASRPRAPSQFGCRFGVLLDAASRVASGLGGSSQPLLLATRSSAALPATPMARERASPRRSPRGSRRSPGRSSRASPRSRSPTCWSARRARRSGRAGTSSRAPASSTALPPPSSLADTTCALPACAPRRAAGAAPASRSG